MKKIKLTHKKNKAKKVVGSTKKTIVAKPSVAKKVVGSTKKTIVAKPSVAKKVVGSTKKTIVAKPSVAKKVVGSTKKTIVAKPSVAKKVVGSTKKTDLSLGQQLQVAFKDIFKKIKQVETKVDLQEINVNELKISIINIEKIANRMKETSESQKLMYKQFNFIEKKINDIEKDLQKSNFFDPIINSINNKIIKIDLEISLKLEKIQDEVLINRKKINEKESKMNEILQAMTKFNLESGISAEQLHDIEEKITINHNIVTNLKLEQYNSNKYMEDKMATDDSRVQDFKALKKQVEKSTFIPEAFKKLQAVFVAMENNNQDALIVKKRLENRLIQFETKLKEMSDASIVNTSHTKNNDSNLFSMKKQVAELSANLDQDKKDMIESFKQRTIIDEQVARRQIDELRDELKVTRQFLNKLSQKSAIDNQGKMI